MMKKIREMVVTSIIIGLYVVVVTISILASPFIFLIDYLKRKPR